MSLRIDPGESNSPGGRVRSDSKLPAQQVLSGLKGLCIHGVYSSEWCCWENVDFFLEVYPSGRGFR